jgi:hypothetical protein
VPTLNPNPTHAVRDGGESSCGGGRGREHARGGGGGGGRGEVRSAEQVAAGERQYVTASSPLGLSGGRRPQLEHYEVTPCNIRAELTG